MPASSRNDPNGGCYAAKVKVIPSNQTLILASEHGAQGGRSGTVGRDLNTASSGAVLQRVTMVTKLPDSTLVYVRADYASDGDASHGDAAPGNVVAIQPKSISPQPQDGAISDKALGTAGGSNALVTSSAPTAGTGLAKISGASQDLDGNPQTHSRRVGFSAQLRPEEQYAQTQRILTDTRPTAHLDVHA